MEAIKSFFKAHLISIVGASIVLLILAIFSIESGCETKQFNNAIDNRSMQANKAVQEAVNANASAQSKDLERQTEDALREKTIAPKLERSRRQSQNSKRNLDAARKTFNEKQNDTSNLSNSNSDNCRRLADLFPNIRFDDCQSK